VQVSANLLKLGKLLSTAGFLGISLLLAACSEDSAPKLQDSPQEILADTIEIDPDSTILLQAGGVDAAWGRCATNSDTFRISIREDKDRTISNFLWISFKGGVPVAGVPYTVANPQLSPDTTLASGTFGPMLFGVDFAHLIWGGSMHIQGLRDRPQVTNAKITFETIGTEPLAPIILKFDVTFYLGHHLLGRATTSVRTRGWGNCM
jgi:hypothetical protein